MVGIDLIPAQPPRGVSSVQGNFLSPAVRSLVKTFVAESAARKQTQQQPQDVTGDQSAPANAAAPDRTVERLAGRDQDAVVLVEQTSYIDAERLAARDAVVGGDEFDKDSQQEDGRSAKEDKVVDVSPAPALLDPSSPPPPQPPGERR